MSSKSVRINGLPEESTGRSGNQAKASKGGSTAKWSCRVGLLLAILLLIHLIVSIWSKYSATTGNNYCAGSCDDDASAISSVVQRCFQRHTIRACELFYYEALSNWFMKLHPEPYVEGIESQSSDDSIEMSDWEKLEIFSSQFSTSIQARNFTATGNLLREIFGHLTANINRGPIDERQSPAL
ncbi:uncharacterized protein LOC100899576 [Galendromus occidentalis]|uniref:Uncharacterized protein LOC100899576 n=1 Tax=Galendromus occidentalis TaxID=34638 RepID=A0AAJ6QXE4_9ACAR|nr:uncharacterized protein LOC100899576 [Galendromus occidentalis]